jgi:hypothetical protein
MPYHPYTIAIGLALAAGVGSVGSARAAKNGNGNGNGNGGPVSGFVQFVTDKRAYLNRGALDGLAPRQVVPLTRGGRGAGSCTIDAVAEHQATCVGGRPRSGDAFRVMRTSARAGKRKPERAPVELPPLIDAKTLATRAAVVADTTIEKVEFTGKRAFGANSTATVSPGFATWLTQPDPQGGYAQERVDGAVHGVEIGSTGLRFDGAFSALRWHTPATLERFRSGTATQFYLWEAEASMRSREVGEGSRTVLAAGRIWPFHAPGLTLLDGVQIGRENEAKTAEGGAYGGLIPSAIGLVPAFDLWAAGVYGSLIQTGTKESLLRVAREEARVGIWHGGAAGTVTEAEGLFETWLGPWRFGGGGRLRWAPQVNARPVAERAHFDVGVRPSLTSGGGLQIRYLGATLLPDAPLRAETVAGRGVVHAVADAHWDARPWLGFAVAGGGHREGDTERRQVFGWAEIRFLRLLGKLGGVWVGAEAEQGWVAGRSGYVQLVSRFERLQLLARGSFNATRFDDSAGGSTISEAGGYLSADGVILSWLRVRAWSMVRVPVALGGEAPVAGASGVIAGASLTGGF